MGELRAALGPPSSDIPQCCLARQPATCILARGDRMVVPPNRLCAVPLIHEPIAQGDASHAFSDRPLQNS